MKLLTNYPNPILIFPRAGSASLTLRKIKGKIKIRIRYYYSNNWFHKSGWETQCWSGAHKGLFRSTLWWNQFKNIYKKLRYHKTHCIKI